MPLYEFKCPTHGVWEEYYSNYDPPTKLHCQEEECGKVSKRIEYSLSVPKPDKHWNGTKVGTLTVHSQKEYDELMRTKEPLTREVKEHIEKRKVQVNREKEEKKDEARLNFLRKELADVEFKEPDNI